MAIKLSEVLFGTFGKLRYQPTAKRVRALTGGNAVVDTFHALLVWEPQRITPVFAVPASPTSTGSPMLPVRYYLPPADVRLDLMEASAKRTVCPYKGTASYWSYPQAENGKNIAWAYTRTFRDAGQIHGLVSFYNERVDITVDGVLQERPVTPWSKQPPSER